ncbi:MAG: hypothetical protein ACRDKW_14715, partial [Actinomycetota bacterium]
ALHRASANGNGIPANGVSANGNGIPANGVSANGASANGNGAPHVIDLEVIELPDLASAAQAGGTAHGEETTER